ncbi:unnamed protein product [Tetraodon nigroviridis]|uniref:(spotted green pufferfish) hypothetical protein n=1 Tax=Tetraodon nigroviridis TaxID=99883 RepID=Q4SR40_TETNG|nr:unnamed protein product [Tetraodon nigroviridis]
MAQQRISQQPLGIPCGILYFSRENGMRRDLLKSARGCRSKMRLDGVWTVLTLLALSSFTLGNPILNEPLAAPRVFISFKDSKSVQTSVLRGTAVACSSAVNHWTQPAGWRWHAVACADALLQSFHRLILRSGAASVSTDCVSYKKIDSRSEERHCEAAKEGRHFRMEVKNEIFGWRGNKSQEECKEHCLLVSPHPGTAKNGVGDTLQNESNDYLNDSVCQRMLQIS